VLLSRRAQHRTYTGIFADPDQCGAWPIAHLLLLVTRTGGAVAATTLERFQPHEHRLVYCASGLTVNLRMRVALVTGKAVLGALCMTVVT
jgi:hypothetical protein